MSWTDSIENKFIIETGDGVEYYPQWLNAVKSKEWNISDFEFIDVAGTLVKRGRPKGRKYELEIYFQGDDHLIDAQAFEESADDPRPWKLTHPYYGVIICQPLSLKFDNSVHNITKITGPIMETIEETNPKISYNYVDRIVEKHQFTLDNYAASFSVDVPKMTSVDINKFQSNLSSIKEKTKKSILETVDFQGYLNSFSTANAALNEIFTETLSGIQLVQSLINAPALFADTVENRLAMIETQFDFLLSSINSITSLGDKLIFSNNIGNTMACMSLAAVTNPDYTKRVDVAKVIDKLITRHDQMIKELDELQSDNGGNPESFIPDAGGLQALSDLVSLTISQLYTIALNSKQERIIALDKDTNPIELTHRLYGLDEADVNLTKLIDDNDIGINELLGLNVNRQIVYYI